MKTTAVLTLALLLVPAVAAASPADDALAASRWTEAVRLFAAEETATGPTLRIEWGTAHAAHASADYATAAAYGRRCATRATAENRPDVRVACAEIVRRADDALTPRVLPPSVPVVREAAIVPPRVVPLPSRLAPVYVHESSTVGPIVLLAAGGVTLATAGLLAVLAHGAVSGCTMDGTVAVCPNVSELARARSSTDYTTAANVAFGLGAAAVVGGGAWWVLSAVLHRDVPVAMTVGADGSVGVAGRF